jgi:Domain of unknown function (DUF5054)/Glycosyl hydrolases family 38 N-terminal domain
MKKNSTIHVVFKTHLDIGFTNTAENVVRNYMESFIPRALKLAEEKRQDDGPDRFIWTTGSWLIHEFLEQSTPSMRKKMEEAILSGEIVWHALPFTTHTELMDPDLFKAGLSLSKRLDERFGKKTIAAKMTDVPGHCRAIIPLLAEAGIRFLHLGVNPASRTADLPTLFRWQSPEGSEVIVNYVSGYGRFTPLEEMDDHLYFAHAEDNQSPPSGTELSGLFKILRKEYEHCLVKASTLDGYAQRLLPFSQNLPVITKEIGDTWIHGAGTDPGKTAAFRQLCRLRNKWRDSGFSLTAPEIDKFSQRLLFVPEHTWGLDEKTHLKDYRNYSRVDFDTARMTSPDNNASSWIKMEQSWVEQRSYLEQSISCLSDSRMVKEAKDALQAIIPRRSSTDGYRPVNPSEIEQLGRFKVSFCPETGAVCSLLDTKTGKEWCNPGEQIGLFRYETFSAASYEEFQNRYSINRDETREWAVPDFSKPGMEDLDNLTHRFYQPIKPEFYLKENTRDICVLVKSIMPPEAVSEYGAPAEIQTIFRFSRDTGYLKVELLWFRKQANRMPEASWISFPMNPGDPQSWFIDKMGEEISPFDVIHNGNRALHAIQSGICYKGTDGQLKIESLDAPLVSPGRPRILEFDTKQPDLSEGFHFNLHNNLWGTNFPMWYEDDGLFRFRLIFD